MRGLKAPRPREVLGPMTSGGSDWAARTVAGVNGIVTGASRGLGLALTRALSARGWRLVVDARDGNSLQRAVAGLAGVTALTGDVTDADHRRRLVEAAGDPIDLLVNNASVLGPTPLPELASYPLEQLRRVYETNVLAPLGLMQLALPLSAPVRGSSA